MNEVINTILKRRSVRAYAPTPLTKEEIETLVKCCIDAPSAKNLQPYKVTVVTDAEVLTRLGEMAKEILLHDGSEAAMASVKRFSPNLFYGAPAVFFISIDEKNDWAALDAGIMSQTIALGAESLGLNSVIVGMIRLIFESDLCEEGKRLLGVPEGFFPKLAVAVGHGTETPVRKEKREDIISYI